MISNLTDAKDEINVKQRNDILFYFCITCIIGLAAFFRSQGYFDGNISFWWDEAHWADKLITKPLKDVISIRPIGFMFLTKQLIKISKDETVFRLVSYLSSILAIPLVFLIAKRIWRSKKAILLMLFVIMGSTGALGNFMGLTAGALSFLIILMIIILNIGFLVFLKMKQPAF